MTKADCNIFQQQCTPWLHMKKMHALITHLTVFNWCSYRVGQNPETTTFWVTSSKCLNQFLWFLANFYSPYCFVFNASVIIFTYNMKCCHPAKVSYPDFASNNRYRNFSMSATSNGHVIVCHLKNTPTVKGSASLSNTWFGFPSGISVGSFVIVGLTANRPQYSIYSNRPHLCYDCEVA